MSKDLRCPIVIQNRGKTKILSPTTSTKILLRPYPQKIRSVYLPVRMHHSVFHSTNTNFYGFPMENCHAITEFYLKNFHICLQEQKEADIA